jgi:hypothetical protein
MWSNHKPSKHWELRALRRYALLVATLDLDRIVFMNKAKDLKRRV